MKTIKIGKEKVDEIVKAVKEDGGVNIACIGKITSEKRKGSGLFSGDQNVHRMKLHASLRRKFKK